jgi:hypothetical protein
VLPEQPIFYPVMNEEYAIQIARDWNVRDSGAGYVTRFEVEEEFLQRYPVQTGIGGSRIAYLPKNPFTWLRKQLEHQ